MPSWSIMKYFAQHFWDMLNKISKTDNVIHLMYHSDNIKFCFVILLKGTYSPY